MNILITGGAGFIGQAIAAKLSSEGNRVTILDNLSPQVHGPNVVQLRSDLQSRYRFIEGDIRSKRDVVEALAEQHAVVHLAAETGTGQSMYKIAHYTDVNVGGTANLIEAMIEIDSRKLKKLIVASSRSIYGEGRYYCSMHGKLNPQDRSTDEMSVGKFDLYCPFCKDIMQPLATTEDCPAMPKSVYASTKLSQEQLVLLSKRLLGVDTIALRFQNVFGPGQSLKNPYTGILSIFSTSLLNGNEVRLFEDGLPSRDFVYIDDVVNSIELSLYCNEGVDGAFNVGSGETKTISEVYTALKIAYGKEAIASVTGEYRVGDIRYNLACLENIKIQLGYTPRVGFAEGITNFVDWVKSQETIEVDHYEAAMSELKYFGLLK